LSQEECVEVELALENDSQALKKVKEFRKTRTAIDKFADILSEPVPEHLIETIRQHEQPSGIVQFPGHRWERNWMKIAASIVIGVSLGTISTNFYLSQTHEQESAIDASRIAGLEKALGAAKVEKEMALKMATTAERKIAGLVKNLGSAVAEKDAAQIEAAGAETKITDISKALEVAVAEKEKALVKVATTEAAEQKMTRTRDIEKLFPVHLVNEALENGTNVSAELQKTILAELNAKPLPVLVASETTELSAEPVETIPLSDIIEMGSLKDLQKMPLQKMGKEEVGAVSDTLGRSFNILGEFTVAGKTCRLLEYDKQQPQKLVIVACKKGSDPWEIVQRQN